MAPIGRFPVGLDEGVFVRDVGVTAEVDFGILAPVRVDGRLSCEGELDRELAEEEAELRDRTGSFETAVRGAKSGVGCSRNGGFVADAVGFFPAKSLAARLWLLAVFVGDGPAAVPFTLRYQSVGEAGSASG